VINDYTFSELLDGWAPFVSPLLLLGQPTRDGRMLAADGSFTPYGEVPVLMGDGAVGYASHRLPPAGVVGLLSGVFRRGDVVFATGVADFILATGLNEGALRLGADLDGMVLKADQSVIKQGTIRGARVLDVERWAWS